MSCSHPPMFSTNTPLPHQLRPTSNLHDIHVLSRSRRNQSILHVSPVRQNRSRKHAKQSAPDTINQLTLTIQLSRALKTLTTHLHNQLQLLLDELPNTSDTNLLSIPPSPPQSPIFSLLTPYPKRLAAYCQQHGFVVRGIVPPTVLEGAERVRICLHAGNTVEEIDGLVGVVGTWAQETKQAQIRSLGEERARL